MDNNELYHYGVLGMKWGVRHNRKSVNRKAPTEKTGNKQNSNIISRHKSNLIAKYKEKGYGDEAAEVAAKHRMQTELIIGAIGTVAVATIATKAATRIGQDYIDKTIKSGKTIQNIGVDGKSTFKDNPFFAAINKSDKNTYGSLYPYEKREMAKNYPGYEGVYKNTIKITKDVKRASVSNARKTFYEKMDKDQNFKKEVLDTLKKTAYSNGVAEYEKTGKMSKQLYDSFNRALATPQFQSAGLHNKYYSELKKKGYNAILDINDTRYSGFKGIAKSPTIFFGDDKWEKIKSRKISDVEINNNNLDYRYKYVIKTAIKKYGTYGAAFAAVSSASKQAAIERYLNEHPNSKLSRKEILALNP